MEATLIKMGTGKNLPVKHKLLPPCFNRYLFVPEPDLDPSIGKWGSAVKAIVNSQKQPIPYGNLGEADIYLPKSKLLGFLEAYPISLPNKGSVYLNLPDLFDGKPLQDDEPNNIKDLPYLAHYPMDEPVEQADVSTHWGPEFKNEIHKLLQRHTRLFGVELGMFNDGIDMPIPFKDEKDLSGLKQSAYNLTKRD